MDNIIITVYHDLAGDKPSLILDDEGLEGIIYLGEAPVYDTKTHKAEWKETAIPNMRRIGDLDTIIPYMKRYLTPYKILCYTEYMDTMLVIWQLYDEISYGAFYYEPNIRGFYNMNDPTMFEEWYGDMAPTHTEFYLTWHKFFGQLK